MAKLLQFTDLHLRDDPAAEVRGVIPERSFEETLYHARRHHWPVDAILLTGDLANDEFDNSYARLAGHVRRWETPVLAMPGNHDNRQALSAALRDVPHAANAVLDLDEWRIVALDSQVPGAVHGVIDAAAFALLEDAASHADGRHLLVALHHHPVSLQSAWLEPIGLHDARAFRERLASLGVRACLFGHAHQQWESEENGVRYLGTPSTGRQFVRGSPQFAESDQPPGYRWLVLHGDGGIETGVEWIGRAQPS